MGWRVTMTPKLVYTFKALPQIEPSGCHVDNVWDQATAFPTLGDIWEYMVGRFWTHRMLALVRICTK